MNAESAPGADTGAGTGGKPARKRARVARDEGKAAEGEAADVPKQAGPETAAANEGRLAAADAYLDSIDTTDRASARGARPHVSVHVFTETFNNMLRGMELKCRDLHDYQRLSEDAACDLPRWEVWYWLTYERYLEKLTWLMEAQAEAESVSDGAQAPPSPLYCAPTSPCYTSDCCTGLSTTVEVSLAQGIHNWLGQFWHNADVALTALKGCDRDRVKGAVQSLIDRLIKDFTARASRLPLSLDLKAYLHIPDEEVYRSMPHWERNFFGTYGLYDSVLDQLSCRKDGR